MAEDEWREKAMDLEQQVRELRRQVDGYKRDLANVPDLIAKFQRKVEVAEQIAREATILAPFVGRLAYLAKTLIVDADSIHWKWTVTLVEELYDAGFLQAYEKSKGVSDGPK